MRPSGEPVEMIVDRAVVMFDAILTVAASASLRLWDAHSAQMRARCRQ